MGFEIEKVGENIADTVKKNPKVWLIGGGVALVGGLFVLSNKSKTSDNVAYLEGYPQPPQDEMSQGGGGGSPVIVGGNNGEQFSQMMDAMLYNQSALMEEQQNQMDAMMGQMYSMQGEMMGQFDDMLEYNNHQQEQQSELINSTLSEAIAGMQERFEYLDQQPAYDPKMTYSSPSVKIGNVDYTPNYTEIRQPTSNVVKLTGTTGVPSFFDNDGVVARDEVVGNTVGYGGADYNALGNEGKRAMESSIREVRNASNDWINAEIERTNNVINYRSSNHQDISSQKKHLNFLKSQLN